MCGIVGAIGTKQSIEIVLEGLEKLEYRGYDSCGIAIEENNGLKVKKSIKRIKDLKDLVAENNQVSELSFGHTRWATHGGVNLENAHPHSSASTNLTVVHNGVIENFNELKNNYLSDVNLSSQTDTEIIVNVLEKFIDLEESITKAINRFTKEVHGSYALIVYMKDSEFVYVLKNKTPIVIGKTDDLITIASDPGAVSNHCQHFYRLENHEFAIINKNSLIVDLYNADEKKEIVFKKIDLANDGINLGDYDHFMLKEIEEQPMVINNIIEKYQNFQLDSELKKVIEDASEIYIVASGTSSYAGLIGKRIFKEKLQKKVEVVIGSEFGYDQNVVSDDAVFIFLSQSGETADSMIVFNKYKETHTTIAITNVKESQLDAGCKYSFLLYAGVEVAVASTKAYTAQVAVLAIIIYQLANDKSIFERLADVAEKQSNLIHNHDIYAKFALEIAKYEQAFVLGRLTDYDVAKEFALKMKEITYININDYPAGELKHGPIALIDESKLVITISSIPELRMQNRSNVEEVKTRGGNVLTIGNKLSGEEEFDIAIEYTDNQNLNALITVITGQLLSYYTALTLNRDVDKPRNLAKSVTVE